MQGFDMVSSLCKQSNARLLRLDLRLVDCPDELSDLWTEDKDGRRRIFTDADVQAVRKMLGRTHVNGGTFSEEIHRFYDLHARYTLSAFGFGSFVMRERVQGLYGEVEKFNQLLLDLRHKVCGLLEARYSHAGIEMHRKILRFHPRVKLGTYILTEAFVRDKCFQRAVEIACRKIRLQETMPQLLGLC